MLKVLSAGLPNSAKDILKNAIDEVFDGAVVIQELTNSNLRSSIRLSKSVEVVLVILDWASFDTCKDIEGGLYQSDKYYTYTNDKELANFLNSKYGLDLVVEDISEEVQDINDTVSNIDETSFISDSNEKSYYIEKLNSKEDTIKSLEARIHELTRLYGLVDETINSQGVEDFRDENIRLNNKILDLESSLESEKGKIANLDSYIDSLKYDKVNLENRLKKVSENYDELVIELNELKVIYSQQSGIIRTKDARISELEKEQEKLNILEMKNKELKETLEINRGIVLNKDNDIEKLKIDLQSKEDSIISYARKIESLNGIKEDLNSANNRVNSLKTENNSLVKDIQEKEKVLLELQNNDNENNSKIESLLSEIEELNKRIKNDDDSLAQLNREKIELQNKVNILEKSNSEDTDTESLIKEIQDLQNKLNIVSSNVFTKLGANALPYRGVNSRVFNSNVRFNNIRFAFASSSDSRRGTYKCLLDELQEVNDGFKYLIVDLVCETSIDYVFSIKSVVRGLEWFNVGGSLDRFISDTKLGNTKVLSVGLGYINDTYFLCIDWNKRLYELENSGYKVILFCGDISNVVGRVLHESFASNGESIIYTFGNSVGSRSLVSNLRGLSNKTDSKIAYFNFNNKNERILDFYKIVSKTNECAILPTKI